MNKVITSINFMETIKEYKIADIINAASTIITCYIITDSVYLKEAFDYSIITRFYAHKSSNSIFSLENMIKDNEFSTLPRYLNYFIYHRLVNLLASYKLGVIEKFTDKLYVINEPIDLSIPYYIITLYDNCLKIYEI